MTRNNKNLVEITRKKLKSLELTRNSKKINEIIRK